MVSAATVESSKENLGGVAEGFSARDIDSTFNPVNREQLRVKRQALSTMDTSDDPLAIYTDYVTYLRRHLPYSRETQQALEACAHMFSDWEIYRHDLRYLRIWLHYAAFAPSPAETFQYLWSKGIGTRYAIFYEEWAAMYETTGHPDRARQTFQRGIELNSVPIKRLQLIQAEFDKRHPVPVLVPASIPISQGLSPRKRTIGETSKASTKKFKVFNDVEDDTITTGRRISDIALAMEGIFPSLMESRKEDRQEALPMAGTTLPSLNVASSTASGGIGSTPVFSRRLAPQLPPLVVFRDEGSESIPLIPREKAIYTTDNATKSHPTASSGTSGERLMVYLPPGPEHSFEQQMLECRGLTNIKYPRRGDILVSEDVWGSGNKHARPPPGGTGVLTALVWGNEHVGVTEHLVSSHIHQDVTEWI